MSVSTSVRSWLQSCFPWVSYSVDSKPKLILLARICYEFVYAVDRKNRGQIAWAWSGMLGYNSRGVLWVAATRPGGHFACFFDEVRVDSCSFYLSFCGIRIAVETSRRPAVGHPWHHFMLATPFMTPNSPTAVNSWGIRSSYRFSYPKGAISIIRERVSDSGPVRPVCCQPVEDVAVAVFLRAFK